MGHGCGDHKWTRKLRGTHWYCEKCGKPKKPTRKPEWRNRLRDAVNQACTCGRSGVGEGMLATRECPACEVWHRMQGKEVQGGSV